MQSRVPRFAHSAGASSAAYVTPTAVATAGADGMMRVFNTADADAPPTAVGHEFAEPVTALSASPGGAVAAAGSEDNSVVLVDTASNETLWLVARLAHAVRGVALSQAGDRLAVVSECVQFEMGRAFLRP